ncbi:hypothetical protein [Pedobacter jeongneungensis]|nr:hypothetical protein [Pedobacter jeongneungensis]
MENGKGWMMEMDDGKKIEQGATRNNPKENRHSRTGGNDDRL